MQNNLNLKKYLNSTLITISLFIILFIYINYKEYNIYKQNFNYKINAIIEKIESKNINITKTEIIEILNSNKVTNNTLKEYGYDLEKDSFITQNDNINLKYTIIKLIILLTMIITLLIIYIKSKLNTTKEIDEIIKLIENINHRNYELNIPSLSEDKLSILKEEIYKTTIMLKENATNSIKDKINLKNLLQDISHQLRTPLTSINILLDNINDYPNMDSKTRNHFIKQIKREITNINFLIENILKLSKFEVNTIDFVRNKVSVKDIVDKSIQNISSLSDLKEITIEVINNSNRKISCDYKWQVEALTNILKNALEYSYNQSKIIIICEENNLYTSITIKDFGKGIDQKDVSNIFKRFYKSKNASNNSIGIGLSLSKAIIEKDNGQVEVLSTKNKGTTFIIKYYSN